jgi:hypothetical protein
MKIYITITLDPEALQAAQDNNLDTPLAFITSKSENSICLSAERAIATVELSDGPVTISPASEYQPPKPEIGPTPKKKKGFFSRG